ncbi:MAG TPA: hypothetical protein VIL20_23700 [Sandaracinaceae bacterium]
MPPLRRIGSALVVVALLAFNLACPGPPAGPPATRFCSGAPASASVDAVEVYAFPSAARRASPWSR